MTTINSFSDFGIEAPKPKTFVGDKINIDSILNIPIIIHDYEVRPSTTNGKYDKCLYLQIEHKEEKRVIFIGSRNLIEMIDRVPEHGFPFQATIIKKDKFSPYAFK